MSVSVFCLGELLVSLILDWARDSQQPFFLKSQVRFVTLKEITNLILVDAGSNELTLSWHWTALRWSCSAAQQVIISGVCTDLEERHQQFWSDNTHCMAFSKWHYKVLTGTGQLEWTIEISTAVCWFLLGWSPGSSSSFGVSDSTSCCAWRSSIS